VSENRSVTTLSEHNCLLINGNAAKTYRNVVADFAKEECMKVLGIVRVIAVVCAGLLAGIYLNDRAAAAARAGLSASSFVQYQQMVHVNFVKMMPPLMLGAALGRLAWLWLMRSQWRVTEFWLIAASLCGIISIAAATRVVNVPLNNQLMTWSASSPPANLRELWAPWERVDAIRTIVAVGVFALEVLALNLRASNKSASSALAVFYVVWFWGRFPLVTYLSISAPWS